MNAARRIVIAGLGTMLLRPAGAAPETLRVAIEKFAAGAAPQTGRVTLEIAPLVDNGNVVPVTIRVASPMTAEDHVRAIALFNEHNPNTEMAIFHLGPRSGRATVSTRVRLATSQQIVALAKMSDGSVWQHRVDVIVTLAACIES